MEKGQELFLLFPEVLVIFLMATNKIPDNHCEKGFIFVSWF